MKPDFYIAAYLIINLFTIIIMAKLFGIFIGNRIKSRILGAFSYILYYFVTCFAYLVFDIPLLALAVNVAALFLISLNYKTTMTKRIFCIVFSYMINFTVEVIVCVITGYYNHSMIEEGSYNNIFGQILAKVITYMVVVLIFNFKNIKNDVRVHSLSWFVTIFVPVSTLYIAYNAQLQLNASKTKICISLVIVFMLNFICLYMYNSLVSFYQSKLNEKLLEQQCELMQEHVEQIRSFRHDMKNQIYVIKKLSDKGMSKEVSASLEQFLDGLTPEKGYSRSGNIIVDSIVDYKLCNADFLGIKVDAEISVPNSLDIEVNDLVSVLGNLLDNAVTALSAEDLSERRLYLKIVYDRQRLIISMKNDYSTPVQIANDEIATTKEDNQSHGYGLKNVKSTIEKYNGYFEVDYANNVFCVDCIMFE